MWLCLQKEKSQYFAFVEPKTTIGSAISNSVVIKGRGMQALHGLIVQKEGTWSFHDFINREVFQLQNNSYFHIAEWDARFLNEDILWKDYGEQLTKSFKKSLKEMGGEELDDVLHKISEELFLNKNLPVNVKKRLIAQFNEFRLAGPIESLLSDPEITDILVERHDEIWIEKNGQLIRSSYQFSSLENYKIYIENLLARFHKIVDESTPFADFVMQDGSRAHLITTPVTGGETYLSIRKQRQNPWRLQELYEQQSLQEEGLAIIHEAIQCRANVLISGATGSGKTTFLRAMIQEIPEDQRTIVIEDIPELRVKRDNSVFLCTRLDAQSQLPPVSLRDLVRQSLRMRPDRIIIGEVRGEEALDLLHAMNTGHQGSFGSLHANSARDALWRLQGLVRFSNAALSESAVLDLIARNIHFVIHLGRGNKGQRGVVEIAAVKGYSGNQLILQERYKWKQNQKI